MGDGYTEYLTNISLYLSTLVAAIQMSSICWRS